MGAFIALVFALARKAVGKACRTALLLIDVKSWLTAATNESSETVMTGRDEIAAQLAGALLSEVGLLAESAVAP